MIGIVLVSLSLDSIMRAAVNINPWTKRVTPLKVAKVVGSKQ